MWPVVGIPKESLLFGLLEPFEVLIWYDCPRTFTFHDPDGGLCLAHWLDEDTEAVRYIVVPVTPKQIEQLKRGELSLRESLEQPRAYIVDQANDGKVSAVWLVKLADVPQDALSIPHTMLLPESERRVELTGRIRELNEKMMRFELHDIVQSTSSTRICEFDSELWDDVYEMLGAQMTVNVFGTETDGNSIVHVLDLIRNE